MRTSSVFNSQHVATRCNGVAKRVQHVKALANKDTLLPTQMLPRLPARTTFVPDTNFVSGTQKMFLILFRNSLCPQQMFPSLCCPRNIMGNSVSATMCSRLPGPLHPTVLPPVAFKCWDRLAGACKSWASNVGICCVEMSLSFGRDFHTWLVKRPSHGKLKRPLHGKLKRPSNGKLKRPLHGKLKRPSHGKLKRPSNGKLKRPSNGKLN